MMVRGGYMFVQRVRRQGDGLWLDIPSEEVERLRIGEGDLVTMSVDRVRAHVQLPDDVRMATDVIMREKADLDYLRDR